MAKWLGSRTAYFHSYDHYQSSLFLILDLYLGVMRWGLWRFEWEMCLYELTYLNAWFPVGGMVWVCCENFRKRSLAEESTGFKSLRLTPFPVFSPHFLCPRLPVHTPLPVPPPRFLCPLIPDMDENEICLLPAAGPLLLVSILSLWDHSQNNPSLPEVAFGHGLLSQQQKRN